jgi:hypothetical protein
MKKLGCFTTALLAINILYSSSAPACLPTETGSEICVPSNPATGQPLSTFTNPMDAIRFAANPAGIDSEQFLDALEYYSNPEVTVVVPGQFESPALAMAQGMYRSEKRACTANPSRNAPTAEDRSVIVPERSLSAADQRNAIELCTVKGFKFKMAHLFFRGLMNEAVVRIAADGKAQISQENVITVLRKVRFVYLLVKLNGPNEAQNADSLANADGPNDLVDKAERVLEEILKNHQEYRRASRKAVIDDAIAADLTRIANQFANQVLELNAKKQLNQSDLLSILNRQARSLTSRPIVFPYR